MNPEQVIDRIERLIAESEPGETRPLDDEGDSIAQKHRDAIRRQA